MKMLLNNLKELVNYLLTKINIMENKVNSPKGGNRGCLCANGKYSQKCCNGTLEEQGIGSLVNQSSSTVTNENGTRTIVRQNS